MKILLITFFSFFILMSCENGSDSLSGTPTKESDKTKKSIETKKSVTEEEKTVIVDGDVKRDSGKKFEKKVYSKKHIAKKSKRITSFNTITAFGADSKVVHSKGMLGVSNRNSGIGLRGSGTGGGGANYGSISGVGYGRGMGNREIRRQTIQKVKIIRASDNLEGVVTTEVNNEKYKKWENKGYIDTSKNSFSTFSIDVDTASYSNIRRVINSGGKVSSAMVRAEEMINYFSYEYPNPDEGPFSVTTELVSSIWNKDRAILHIGVQGKRETIDKIPPMNLVFLIDVSGSMSSRMKLPLLKSGLKMLIKKLRKTDTVSIVVYAGASGTVLEPTSGDKKSEIVAALDRLSAGGSTNGQAGINLAYLKAKENFKKDGINRVIICTDGDFNVGISDWRKLKELIAKKRETGITLTTLGFGSGNYNDTIMEQLADAGNGNYSYIDSLNEAKKVLVTEMGSTLKVIAKDVKIQVEFNPKQVAYYRLIGYENRALKKEDFKNDKVDAGEIGSGHNVTAIYEVVFVDSDNKPIDDSRYGDKKITKPEGKEIAYLKLRYKKPKGTKSIPVSYPIFRKQLKNNIDDGSNNLKFSLAVASFAQYLKGGKYIGNMKLKDIISLAKKGKGGDEFGYRAEFIKLISLYKDIQ